MTGKAPFRADEVGSLLRPQAIKDARLAHAQGRMDAAALKAVEDDCIRDVVKKQEEAGLQAVTDGEFRRSWWHFDFLAGLDGVEMVTTEGSLPFQGAKPKNENVAVTHKVAFTGHYMLEHFRFLQEVTNVTPKMTIPAPSQWHSLNKITHSLKDPVLGN